MTPFPPLIQTAEPVVSRRAESAGQMLLLTPSVTDLRLHISRPTI